MGNCVARKAFLTGKHAKKHDEPPTKEEGNPVLEHIKSLRNPSTTIEGNNKQKKTVRFSLDDEEEEERRKGVVRIRLVVTKEELRQMLNGESADELLSAMKLGSTSRRRMDSGDDGGDMNCRRRRPILGLTRESATVTFSRWRPVLEGVPEL